MRRLFPFAFFLFPLSVLLFAAAAPAAAHEIGRAHVDAHLSSGNAYVVEVIAEPAWLEGRLTALREPGSDDERVLAENVAIMFDGVRVLPAQVERLPAPRGGDGRRPSATFRLKGRIPSGARTFSFSSKLVYGSYALMIHQDTGGVASEPVTQWLVGAQTSEAIAISGPGAGSRAAIARQYLILGFTHILPKGLDHILFVLGIFFLSPRLRHVLLQVTTFTIAHSITLALSMYGVVSLPGTIVEPLIALSIAYVAIENLITREMQPWRLALVFSFGLLHGLGFAGVLTDLGLPRRAFAMALVSFNVGVEAAQLTVIALAAAAVWHWRRDPVLYRRRIVVPASVAIAIMGMYWTVARWV